jgi:hypothetical protein
MSLVSAAVALGAARLLLFVHQWRGRVVLLLVGGWVPVVEMAAGGLHHVLGEG